MFDNLRLIFVIVTDVLHLFTMYWDAHLGEVFSQPWGHATVEGSRGGSEQYS